jgi:hypothetical protein
MEQTIINDYTQRASLAAAEAAKYKKLANTYSLLRLGIFAMVAVTIAFAIHFDNFSIIAIAFVLQVFAFDWLVARQSAFEKHKQY